MYRVSAGDTDTALAIDALRVAARCRLRVFAVEHPRTEATTGSVKSHDFVAYLFDPLYTHLDLVSDHKLQAYGGFDFAIACRLRGVSEVRVKGAQKYTRSAPNTICAKKTGCSLRERQHKGATPVPACSAVFGCLT